MTLTAYGKGREQQAAEDRLRLEKEKRSRAGFQVALVSVKSINTLKEAYPNYFLNTDRFSKELEVLLYGA